MNHFDEMACMLYLDGQLDADHATELAGHAATCSECRALLRTLESEGAWLRAALEEQEEAVPARLITPPTRARASWGWLTAFGAVSAGCYMLWQAMIEPWQQRINTAGFSGGNVLTMIFFQSALWNGWGMVRNVMESIALVTIGISLFLLFRRTWRRRASFAIVMLAVVCGAAASPPATAGEVKHGKPDYTLAAGEVLHNDLIVAADHVTIDGTVDGDLIVMGQELSMNGHVTGDVLFFGREVRIEGPVDGNVRNWSESAYIESAIGKNVTSWCGHVDLDSKGRIGGSLMAGAGDVRLDGPIGRDLMAWTGSTEINSLVGGAATLGHNNLSIGSKAELRGPVTYHGRKTPDVAPGAKLAFPIDIKADQPEAKFGSASFYVHQALYWGSAFLFGLLIALLMPGFFADAARASRRIGLALGVGAITLVGGLILAIIAIVLVFVGITAGAAIAVLLFPAIYAAQIFVGFWLGEIILGKSEGSPAILARLALGLLLIRVLGNIPVAGHFVWFAVVLWGVGALMLAIHRSVRTNIVPA